MQSRAVGKWKLVGWRMGRKTVRRAVEWKSVELRMGHKPAERWMQGAVRSGPASRLTAAGNILIVFGSTLIGPRDSLAKPEDFGRGRKREQQKTIQTMDIRVSGSKSYT